MEMNKKRKSGIQYKSENINKYKNKNMRVRINDKTLQSLKNP